MMARIVLDIQDEKKVEAFLAFIRDIPYVKAKIDPVSRKWKGNLPVLDNPIPVEEFRTFTREELHER